MTSHHADGGMKQKLIEISVIKNLEKSTKLLKNLVRHENVTECLSQQIILINEHLKKEKMHLKYKKKSFGLF